MRLFHGLSAAACLFGTTWLLVHIWLRISIRARIIDQPTHRSSHTIATPRGGGTGIVVACALALGIVGDNGWSALVPIAVLAGIVAAVSFVDDVRSLSSVVRLVLHVGAAVGAVVVLGPIREVAVPFFGIVEFSPYFAWIASIVWVVGLTNVYNFMDGIDGIAAGQGIVSGLAWMWFGLFYESGVLAWLGLTVAATCAGFLVHNWSPARVFMGDVGSAFLGFVLAMCPLLAIAHPHAIVGEVAIPAVPVFAVLTVWPFIADGMITFLRRLKRGENVLTAHRSHLYQRLTLVGWRHAHVSLLYIAWAVVGAALGCLYLVGLGDGVRAFVVLSAGFSLAAVYGFVAREQRRTRRA